MADGVVCSQVHSRVLVQNSGNIDKYACIKCSVYETQLKEALDELGLARFVIDILKKGVNHSCIHKERTWKSLDFNRRICGHQT